MLEKPSLCLFKYKKYINLLNNIKPCFEKLISMFVSVSCMCYLVVGIQGVGKYWEQKFV